MSQVVYKTRNKRPGCLFYLFLSILLGGFVAYRSVHIYKITHPIGNRSALFGVDEFPKFDEVWSCGQGSNKVIRIPITGMITLRKKSSVFSSSSSASTALRAIRRATHDKDVLALILDIDSGGGGITASDIIYNALLNFKKQNPKRKIIALYGDVAASGAYYISLAADHIIARPTSITGSIGVIVPSVNFFDLATKYGVKDTTVKSGANKDMLNPLAEPSEKQKQIMQSVVNDLYEHFVSLVAKNRKLSEEKVHELADGRIFTAKDALRLKLIDEIGYWDAAMTRTEEMLAVDHIIVYRYENEFSLKDLIKATQKINPQSLLSLPHAPRIQYRWQ